MCARYFFLKQSFLFSDARSNVADIAGSSVWVFSVDVWVRVGGGVECGANMVQLFRNRLYLKSLTNRE